MTLLNIKWNVEKYSTSPRSRNVKHPEILEPWEKNSLPEKADGVGIEIYAVLL